MPSFSMNQVSGPKGSKCFSRKFFGLIAIITIASAALIIGLAVGLTRNNGSESTLQERMKRAEDILSEYPLVDGHNDLAWHYRTELQNNVYGTVDLKTGWNQVQTDIPRLRQGKLGAQFWAAFVDCNSTEKDAVRQSLDQVDVIRKFINRFNQDLQLVTTAQGIEDAFRAGKIGSLIGLEGGHSIGSSLGNLRMFYELGVRYMTLTQNCDTPWADSWTVDDLNKTLDINNGLTEFGKVVIQEMNRVGMMVDISHVSVKTMYDVLNITRAPIIFSHSNAFTICNHYRNVKDEILNLTKINGGVVMVTFYSPYVNCFPDYNSTVINGTLSQAIDHIDYIKNLIGIDYIGIGGAYDGVIGTVKPVGLEDVSKYPDLFAELLRRGYTSDELQKLAGKNLVRVFRQVEKVRDNLKNEPPHENLIPSTTWIKNTCQTSF